MELKKILTLVVIEALVVLVDDVGRDGVEEGPVVGDDEESVGPCLKVIFQPGIG